MEMHQIRYFLAVAKTLNFTQAAHDCNVAQPSLSRAVKLLEEELGGALFRRERALTHLTSLGERMRPLLQQCYDNASAAKTLAAAHRKGFTAPLRLAVSHSVNLILLVPMLTELARAFPGLELLFCRGTAVEILDRLKAGTADLAVAGRVGELWERLDRWPLYEEGYELVLHRNHPLGMRNLLSLDDLKRARLVHRAYDEEASAIGGVLRSVGIEEKAGESLISDQDLLALIEANLGVALMPQTNGCAGALRSIPVDGLSLRREVSLYAVAGRQRSAAATGLMNLLRAYDWLALPALAGRRA